MGHPKGLANKLPFPDIPFYKRYLTSESTLSKLYTFIFH